MSPVETPSSTRPFPRLRDWCLLAAFLGVLLCFELGTRGLNEPDEGRYANIALAMARPGGGWWEPRQSGYGHYDKPPLIYWTTALSFRAFGVNEWAARLPPLFGAMCALAGLGWAGWRLRGARAAWWAVLICGASVQFWTMARILSPDMLLTGWCTLAVAAWAEARHRGGAWMPWALSLGFWTLALWTKATPALIPLAGLAAGVWLTGDPVGRRALRLGWLLPAILLLGSPWYLLMLHRYPELKAFFFQRELAGRLAGRVDGRHGSKLYYVPVSLVGWLPWWPCGAWVVWRERVRLFDGTLTAQWQAWRRRLGIEGWIVAVGFLIFSLASSKLPSYTVILAPWAALGLARLVAGAAARSPRPFLLVAGGVVIVLLIGTSVLPPRFESRAGVNSTTREVCRFLQAHGANRVDTDRYWAGMELYLGEDVVHYVTRVTDPPTPNLTEEMKARRMRKAHRRERASDPGVAPDRFIEPEQWPALPPGASVRATASPGGWWLVHFRKQRSSPLAATMHLGDHGNPEIVKIGDFFLYHMPASP